MRRVRSLDRHARPGRCPGARASLRRNPGTAAALKLAINKSRSGPAPNRCELRRSARSLNRTDPSRSAPALNRRELRQPASGLNRTDLSGLAPVLNRRELKRSASVLNQTGLSRSGPAPNRRELRRSARSLKDLRQSIQPAPILDERWSIEPASLSLCGMIEFNSGRFYRNRVCEQF
jgi:hypothetical protein